MRNPHTSMQRRTLSGLLVVACALACSQGVAETTEVRTLTPRTAVSWTDLDLASDRDMQTLHARIRSAARTVCQDLQITGAGPQGRWDHERCLRDTYSASIDRIGQSLAATDPALAGRWRAARVLAIR